MIIVTNRALRLSIYLGINVVIAFLCTHCSSGFMSQMSSFTSIQEIRRVDDGCMLVVGGGGNSAVFIGDSAIVVVDTKMNAPAQELFEIVQKASKNGTKPIIIVNTHLHGDHVKGNYLYKNSRIIAGKIDPNLWIETSGKENLPTEWFQDSLRLFIGGESLLLLNMGRAHTFADVVVYAEQRKILIGGDIVLNKVIPVLNPKSGSRALGYRPALESLVQRMDIQTVLPGHGSIGGKDIIVENINYFKEMERVSEPNISEIERKKTFEQYKDWVDIPFFANNSITLKFLQDERKLK